MASRGRHTDAPGRHAGRAHTCKRSRRHSGRRPWSCGHACGRSVSAKRNAGASRRARGWGARTPTLPASSPTVGSPTRRSSPLPPAGCTSQGRTPAAPSGRLRVDGGQQVGGPEPTSTANPTAHPRLLIGPFPDFRVREAARHGQTRPGRGPRADGAGLRADSGPPPRRATPTTGHPRRRPRGRPPGAAGRHRFIAVTRATARRAAPCGSVRDTVTA